MRRLFSIFFLIAFAFVLVCGCSNQGATAISTEAEVEQEATPEGFEDSTSSRKEIAYKNFEGKTESDIVTDEKIDFAKLFDMAGLEYYKVDDGIIAKSIDYNAEESFVIFVRIDPAYHIVNGSTIFKNRQGDDEWKDIVEHESATDFIFDAKMGDDNYRIGVDELDYLWREVRLLTAPADKINAVNAAVDAEIESYYVDSIPEE